MPSLPHNKRYWIDIAWILLIKGLLLTLLWWVCFSHPFEKSLTAERYAAHFFPAEPTQKHKPSHQT